MKKFVVVFFVVGFAFLGNLTGSNLKSDICIKSESLKNNLPSKDLIILNMVCLVPNLLEVSNLDKFSQNKKFEYLRKIAQLKTKEEKEELVKKILSSGDYRVVSEFIGEVFVILAEYLKEEFFSTFNVMYENFLDYFLGKTSKINFTSNDNFALRGKKQNQIASAIFGAIANACVQTGQVVNAQTEEDQKEGVLSLFGTAFGLASQITGINATHSSDNKSEIWVNEEFEKLKKEVLKKGWISESLAFDELVEKILKKVFKVLQGYFKDRLEDFLEYLSEKLVDALCGQRIEIGLGLVVLHDFGENIESGKS